MKRYNIAIVGSGPAGLSAAIALHDDGHQVCILERFEAARPVGSGLMLQPTGLAVLETLGLREQIEACGQRIDGMLGRIAPNGKVVLDIQYRVLDENLYGVAIHRASLFDVLFSAVRHRNIPVHTSHEVVDLVHAGEQTSPVLGNGSKHPETLDLVIDASGRGSALIPHAIQQPSLRNLQYGALWSTVNYSANDFADNLLEQRYSAANIMVGVLPCGTLPQSTDPVATFFWSIRADHYQPTLDAGIDKWKSNVLGYWPAVEPLLDQFNSFEQLTYARYSHHTLSKPYGKHIVFIGDCAHATSPQLGQGANMALLDSLALAEALSSTQTIEQATLAYARTRRTHVRLFQLASMWLTPFYQSDSRVMPWVRDLLFDPVSRLPFARKLVARLGAGLLLSNLTQR